MRERRIDLRERGEREFDSRERESRERSTISNGETKSEKLLERSLGWVLRLNVAQTLAFLSRALIACTQAS